MDYLKLFQTHEEYEAFVSGGTMVKPNVSHCVSENEVHYNPLSEETRIVATFNISNTGNYKIWGCLSDDGEGYAEYEISGASVFDSIEIDGVEYTLSEIENQMVYNSSDHSHYNYPLTQGTHTIKYTLKDPTTICDYMFANIHCETFTIPNTVIYIDNGAFNSAYITNLIIGDGVTNIGIEVFWDSLFSSITIGEGIDRISGGMFRQCNPTYNEVVLSVNLPSSIKIANYAFCDVLLDQDSISRIESINPNACVCEEEEYEE